MGAILVFMYVANWLVKLDKAISMHIRISVRQVRTSQQFFHPPNGQHLGLCCLARYQYGWDNLIILLDLLWRGQSSRSIPQLS